jgi:hypothetical protein
MVASYPAHKLINRAFDEIEKMSRAEGCTMETLQKVISRYREKCARINPVNPIGGRGEL